MGYMAGLIRKALGVLSLAAQARHDQYMYCGLRRQAAHQQKPCQQAP
jgi:hypothetical protein